MQHKIHYRNSIQTTSIYKHNNNNNNINPAKHFNNENIIYLTIGI